MNAKQLKELIKNVPDDVTVVVSAYDHSYREVGAHLTTGLKQNGNWTEDFGEEYEAEYGKRLPILLID